jgi:hypothetical protein
MRRAGQMARGRHGAWGPARTGQMPEMRVGWEWNGRRARAHTCLCGQEGPL